MHTPTAAALLCIGLALGAAAAHAQAPILRHTFDDSDGGWTAGGTNARASINTQTTYNGKGALKYEYDVKPGAQSMLLLSTPGGALDGAKALRFWVRADYPMALGVLLQEQDGGRYTVVVSLPKGTWQEVALSPSDFVLAAGPDDPRDPNSRLDMERVANIALADVLQTFGVANNPDVAKLVGLLPGSHALYVDDFTVSGQSLPAAFSEAKGEFVPDTFVRPQASWLTMGGVTVSPLGSPGQERGLQATYRQVPGRLVALMHSFPAGKVQGMDRLSLKASCTQAAILLVAVEETGGGKFSTTVSLAEGGAAQSLEVSLADLTPSDDSKVKDRKVKPELVSQIAVLDATGMAGAVTAERDCTLRLTAIRFHAAK